MFNMGPSTKILEFFLEKDPPFFDQEYTILLGFPFVSSSTSRDSPSMAEYVLTGKALKTGLSAKKKNRKIFNYAKF